VNLDRFKEPDYKIQPKCCFCNDDADHTYDELSQWGKDALHNDMSSDAYICYDCALDSIKEFCDAAGIRYSENCMDVID
jgi:hypothetical protein